MVEKIIISPESVRGLGNIVSPKSTSDFTLSDADLTSASETVNGMSLAVYHMQLTSAGILTVAITVGSLVFRRVTVGTQITVTATAVDRLGAAVSGVPVVLTIGGTTYDAVNTDSSGKVVKTYTTGASDVGTLSVSAASEGYSTATSSITVVKHTSCLTDASGTDCHIMTIANSTRTIGESFELSGVLKIDGTGTSGLPVQVYQNGVALGDPIRTTTGGAWSKSVTATTAGTKIFKAVYEGSSVNASDETTEYTCTVNKKPSNLNMTVPTVHYSDAFNVVGELKSNGVAISGASVVLHWKVNDGAEQTATETTGSDGKVTFARSAPTAIESYTFWLTYAGDDTYVASQATEDTVSVDKESTSFYTVTPQDGTQYDSGDDVTITGYLKSDDDEVLTVSNPTVYVKENGTTLGSGYANNSTGAFSITIQGLSDGNHTLTVEYAGDGTYYNGATIQRSITLLTDAVVSTVALASDKSILSYVDSESATLTATPKTSQNVAIPGLPVVFYSGLPEVVNNCTDNSAFSTWYGSPTYSSTGLFLPSTSRVVYNDSIFDLSTSTYKIYLTCTKENTHYLCARVVSSVGSYSNSTIEINDTTIQFLDGNNIYTPSGLGDTIDVLIEWGPSTQKLYIDGDLVATKSISFVNSSDLNYLMFLELTSNEGFSVRNLVIYEDSSDEFVGNGVSDSNGICSVSYQSKDAGDITIQASCNNITSSSVLIEDCQKYIQSTSYNSSSSAYTTHQIYDCGSSIPLEISGKIKCNNNGFGIMYSTSDNPESNCIIAMVALNSVIMANIVNNSTPTQTNVGTFSANIDIPFKIEYESGVAKIYFNDSLIQTTNIGFSPRYVYAWEYGTGRTLTITDLKIKSL